MVNPITSATALLIFSSAVSTVFGAALPPRAGGTRLSPVMRHGHEKNALTQRSFGPEIHQTYQPFHSSSQIQQDDDDLSAYLDPVEKATAFVRSKVTSSDYSVKSSYTSDLTGITHVYLRQKVNGLEVINGNININLDRHGRVISYGDSFTRPIVSSSAPATSSILGRFQRGLEIVSSKIYQVFFDTPERKTEYAFVYDDKQPIMDPTTAVLSLLAFVRNVLPQPATLEQIDPSAWTVVTSLQGDQDVLIFEDVPFALSPMRARPAYMQVESGELLKVWDIEIELQDHWFNAQVNAHDGTVAGLVDWVSDAAADVYYNVIPFGFNDPSDTDQVLIHNPHDLYASPQGWHAQVTMSGHIQIYNVTIGNNVYAHTNPDGGYNWEENYRPSGKISETGDLIFDYVADFGRQEPKEYEDAAVTNLFYWCNIAHDLYYRYGFNEKAGNFQQDNLGRGRKNDDGAGDAVIANAQDGSGRDNANFATPPDGRHGKMRMYVWDNTEPMRDGDFESGIIIHEYTHGVSNRLTGGPHDSNCLGWGEAGGMGEGWGDFVATIIRMNASHTREAEFGMGDWANGGEGIRNYKYSTSMKTNPSTYKIMDKFGYWGVHAKGEVWAEMLYEVYWALVDRHGFTPEWFPPLPDDNGDLTEAKKHIVSHGNTLALQLVIDGMKLQPCRPSFTDARDAILDADIQLTGGENYCTIYAAFAKRGLGYGAGMTKDESGWFEKRKESFELPPGKCD